MADAVKEYQTREEMPDRFRETLEQMMKSQAYRELAAARMFGHGLQYVAEQKWLKFMVWHIGEETEHYLAVARMYEKFTGESVQDWVNQRIPAASLAVNPRFGRWDAASGKIVDRGTAPQSPATTTAPPAEAPPTTAPR